MMCLRNLDVAAAFVRQVTMVGVNDFLQELEGSLDEEAARAEERNLAEEKERAVREQTEEKERAVRARAAEKLAEVKKLAETRAEEKARDEEHARAEEKEDAFYKAYGRPAVRRRKEDHIGHDRPTR